VQQATGKAPARHRSEREHRVQYDDAQRERTTRERRAPESPDERHEESHEDGSGELRRVAEPEKPPDLLVDAGEGIDREGQEHRERQHLLQLVFHQRREFPVEPEQVGRGRRHRDEYSVHDDLIGPAVHEPANNRQEPVYILRILRHGLFQRECAAQNRAGREALQWVDNHRSFPYRD